MNNITITRACVRSSPAYARAFRTSIAHPAQKDETLVKQDQKSDSQAVDAITKKRKKTMEEMDEEIRAAMEGRSGDGGISGAELEGGKAVSMKRGVRDNMFRYI